MSVPRKPLLESFRAAGRAYWKLLGLQPRKDDLVERVRNGDVFQQDERELAAGFMEGKVKDTDRRTVDATIKAYQIAQFVFRREALDVRKVPRKKVARMFGLESTRQVRAVLRTMDPERKKTLETQAAFFAACLNDDLTFTEGEAVTALRRAGFDEAFVKLFEDVQKRK